MAENPEPALADVRANTVLPADRRPVTLATADGHQLVAELALPPGGRPAAATLVCLHPLPTHGGSSDSHLLRKAAWRLPAMLDAAVLRFNTRGTTSSLGTSEGAFAASEGECHDVAAALDLIEASSAGGRELPPPWLLGWSFGTDLVLRYGCDPGVAGALLVSPPLRYSTPADLGVWAASGKPLIALVPELDDYLRPDEARTRFGVVGQAQVVAVPGAKHLFVGYTEKVLDVVAEALVPGSAPLPRRWPAAQVETLRAG